MSQQTVLFSTLLFIIAAGCAPKTQKTSQQKVLEEKGTSAARVLIPSESNLLNSDDYNKFQLGRSEFAILRDIQWRGNLEEGCIYNGKPVVGISYGILGGSLSEHGETVWAIFVDDKFVKFVRWPMGVTDVKIGDFSRLIWALESKAVDQTVLDNEIKSKGSSPHHVDPGLTTILVILDPLLELAHIPSFKRNTKLRDQFNAARLILGMRESEVDSIFNSKPIQTGQVQTGIFKIYGSTESFDILPDLHYSNILTIFNNGQLAGIYSGGMAPGGEQGLRKLQNFVNEMPQKE